MNVFESFSEKIPPKNVIKIPGRISESMCITGGGPLFDAMIDFSTGHYD